MSLKQAVSNAVHGLRAGFIALTVFQFSLGGPLAASLQAREKQPTRTPIKHLIVLIGENRTFDHVFATYVPKSEDSVSHLQSNGIINVDGPPGKHFSKAAQFQAVAPFKSKFFISLDKEEKSPYQILPPPTLNFAPTATLFPPGNTSQPRQFPEPHRRRR
jgi:phospholipase C